MDYIYEYHGDCITRKFAENYVPYRVYIHQQPLIGQKYKVVYYCDDNYPLNYTIEVTEDNWDEITFCMNDTMNDITHYELIEQ